MYVIFDTLLSVYQDACVAMRYMQLNACNKTDDNLNVCVYNRDNLNN